MVHLPVPVSLSPISVPLLVPPASLIPESTGLAWDLLMLLWPASQYCASSE